jgi:small subunit ribosomal protein S5
MGCGSWECKCVNKHSVPQKISGKEGSTKITIRPAPRGLGLAGNDVVKKVLTMAGVQDVWSSMSGGRNVYNMAMATVHALEGLNTLKPMPDAQ